MEKLAQVVAQMAEKLGMETSRLWPEVVRLHWVIGLVELLTTPFIILLLYSVMRRCSRAVDETEFEVAQMACVGGVVVCGLVAAVISVLYIASIGNMVGTVVAPEASLVMKALNSASK